MERTFVPKNRIKINIALAYLLSGTQGVEPRQRELLDNKLSSFLLQPPLRWLRCNATQCLTQCPQAYKFGLIPSLLYIQTGFHLGYK